MACKRIKGRSVSQRQEVNARAVMMDVRKTPSDILTRVFSFSTSSAPALPRRYDAHHNITLCSSLESCFLACSCCFSAGITVSALLYPCHLHSRDHARVAQFKWTSTNVSTETPVVDCHCPNCRKHHVSAFSTFVVCEKESVAIHGDFLASFQHSCSEMGDVQRLFCKRCFSKIATRTNDKIMVCLGLMEDESIPDNLNTKWKKERTKWQYDLAATWPRARPRQTRHGLPAPP